jgi:hypothetical protein
MPIPIDRPSLTTPLTARYATQKAGGAFDDKAIIESGVDPLFASFQAATFQINDGFLTKVQQGVSNFVNDGNNMSYYVRGLDTTKYTSTFPS